MCCANLALMLKNSETAVAVNFSCAYYFPFCLTPIMRPFIRSFTSAVLGLALVVLLVPTAQQAAAQDLQVGYTDHELLIVNMPEYQDLRQQLEQDYSGTQEELQGLIEEYQQMAERYQRQQALLSDERRQEREQELAQLEQQIRERQQQGEQALQQREAELLSPLLQRVDEAIQEVANEQSLDLVLRNQVGPMQPVILYVNPDRIQDITLPVARKLGIQVDENEITDPAQPMSSNE